MANTALRSAVLRLALGILILDAVAITAYYVADIALRPETTRYIFFGAWMLLTLVIVLPGLHKVRVARGRRRVGA